MSGTFVIAEMASAHDGHIEKACRLVRVARDAGADAVKAQYWSSADRLADRRHADGYREFYRRHQLGRSWLDVLKHEADQAGLEFLCTVYLPEDLPTITPFVDRYKIASFEAGDHDFIRAHFPFGKPICVSTGLCSDGDLRALTRLRAEYPALSLLHCVSAYPCPPGAANLRAIDYYGLDGWSDHTAEPAMGALAVMAGARIIEVHFRLDETDRQNPDRLYALSPRDLREYVRLVRLAEQARGERVRRVAGEVP